jgi:hypothetical protein
MKPFRVLPLSLLIVFAAQSAFAARLGPCLLGQWNIFPVYDQNTPILLLQLDFVPHETKGSEPYSPSGLLNCTQAPNDSYLACSWPIGEPDRNDHFAVQWTGYWQPGAITCELRLRADEDASLALDGEPFLACHQSPAGVTRTVELDKKRHHLQLDYVEVEGPAYVFLEWREPGRAWNPIPATQGKAAEPSQGWQGAYSLGKTFDQPAFTRRDPMVAFNWGLEGPFDRDDDLPTASLEWGHEGGQFFGQIAANREGSLRFVPLGLPAIADSTAVLSGGATFLKIAGSPGKPLLSLLFDQAGEGLKEGDLFPLPGPRASGPQSPSFTVPTHPGRPLRFWEEAAITETGSAVANHLEKAHKAFEETRPRLAEGLAPFDEPLIPQGRWWCRLLLDSLAHQDLLFKPPLPKLGEGAGGEGLNDLLSANLPTAVSAMLALCARDLLVGGAPLLEAITPGQASRVFVSSGTRELHLLVDTLSGSMPAMLPDERKGRLPVTQSPRWKTTGLAEGLARALSACRSVQPLINRNPKEGTDIGAPDPPFAKLKLENWWIAGNPFDITFRPDGLLLEQKGGTFLEFERPARLIGFRMGKKGEWLSEVEMKGTGGIEAGPPSRFQGVEWNHLPLLMVNRNGRLRAATTPTEKGSLKMMVGEKPAGIPRR